MAVVDFCIIPPAVLLGIVCLSAPILLALRNARRSGGRVSGSGAVAGSRPFILIAAAALVGVGILLWRPLPLALPDSVRVFSAAAGAALYFPGTLLYLWSLATLGPQFGVSSISGAGLYRDHRLVTDGPFAVVRHPMYLGVLLAAAGALLIFGTWAMLLFAPLSLVVVVRAGREEELLADEFGDAWKKYCTGVPKWLPRLR